MGIVQHHRLQHFQKPLATVIAENPSVPQALEKVMSRQLPRNSMIAKSVAEMYGFAPVVCLNVVMNQSYL